MSELKTWWLRWLNSLIRQEMPELAPAEPSTTPAGPAPAGLHAKAYRPEIDGLRALAIVPVLLYHAGLGFPGGFVGVDIFFVISGYLITSLLHQELEKGTFSLLNFWGRRARRIVPASLVLTLAVLAAGWWLFLPPDFQRLGSSALAQALFASNLYFAKGGVNYFADVSVLPLIHTWSLAVEEQFYIFFPLVLLVCYRSAWLRRRGVLLGLFVTGVVLSLACSMATLQRYPTLTFFLLPTRAWELLLGSILAISPRGWTPWRQGLRQIYSGLGLLAILFAIFSYQSATPFPGLAALPPCLGAALIIWSNGPANHPVTGSSGLTFIGRLLASPGPVFIGLISYSLYLWHWPLLAFVSYRTMGPLSLACRLGIVAASLTLATLSWWLVETPFRKRHVFPSRTGVLVFAAGGLVAVCLIGLSIMQTHGFPRRFPAEVDALSAGEADVPFVSIRTKDVLAGRLAPVGTSSAKPQLLLWGDSHAAAALPAFDLYCTRHGIAGRAALHSSTTPLLNYFTRDPYGLNAQAVPYSQAVFDYIQRERLSRVFLVNYWTRDLRADPARLEEALGRTIEAFQPTGVTLYILLQVPTQQFNVPRAMALDTLSGMRWPDWRTTVQEHRAAQATLYRVAAKYSSPQCIFVDPAPAFLDPDGVHYQVIRDGHLLYIDRHHLSAYAAQTILEPLLEHAMNPL
jgi:peptidoglycan/LPS O-acetylase OafA/YrhL